MSQVVIQPRLSVVEYQQLAENGALDANPHVELLDGLIVGKKPKTPLHDGTVDLIAGLLRECLTRGWFVRNHKLIVTGESCPEPDLAIISGRPLDYQRQHPTAADCAMVVEVAHTTVRVDRDKSAIYARAGVPEYWLVNLVDWQLERMTQPSPEGWYQQTNILTVNDAVPLLIAGSEAARISLRELLTPPA